MKMLPPLLVLMLGWPLQATELPPDSSYVIPQGGHLTLDGKRVRYWGFIGGIVNHAWGHVRPGANTQDRDRPLNPAERTAVMADIDLMSERLQRLGFNLVRAWNRPDADAAYQVGDGSWNDMIAYGYASLERRDIRIWNSLLNLDDVDRVTPQDVSIIDDQKTSHGWSTGITELTATLGKAPKPRCLQGSIDGMAGIWDPRLEALGLQRMRKMAEWPNHYKQGLRMCDDPQFIVWEQTNEEMWLKGMFNGRWQKLPAFFRNSLIERWNTWLRAKYGADEALRSDWKGLLPGESLASGTVLLAPLAGSADPRAAINDSNPAAVANLAGLPAAITRDDVSRARGEAVIAFFTDLSLIHI
jgi:hypothetical protein